MCIKEAARRMVRDAIKRGELVRPDSCSYCGNIPPRAADGRSQIHGHHHDYSKPLDVHWICVFCHRKETPFPKNPGGPAFGERNGQAKLTRELVEKAKRLHERGVPYRHIAADMGVDHKTVMRAVKGELWVHTRPADAAMSAQGGA